MRLGVDGLRAGVITAPVVIVRPLVQSRVQSVFAGVQLMLAGVEARVTRINVFPVLPLVPGVTRFPGVCMVPRVSMVTGSHVMV